MVITLPSILNLVGYVLVAASVALASIGFITRRIERQALQARLRRPEEMKRRKYRLTLEFLLPAQVAQRMRQKYEHRMRGAPFALPWHQFITLSIAIAFAGFLFGTFYFRNVMAGIAMAALCYMVPDQLLGLGAGSNRDKVHEQLQLAIQIFSSEYRTGRSIARAFLRTAPQLPAPIRDHFERAARRLNNGDNLDLVLEEFVQNLQHPFAALFASNCKAVDEDAQAAAMFDATAYQLNQWRIRYKSHAAALSGGRALGLILNAMLPLVYFVNLKVTPATRVFLTEVPAGRILTVVMLLGALGTFLINKYLLEAEW